LKDIDYDKTVLLGHFNFHFSRVDFLLCEDDTTHKTRLHLLRVFKLQYCTNFVQLILRKIINIVATRCHILKLKCTKFDFGWGSAPDPAEGA